MLLRVAAYGVIVDEGRVLLAHWREQGLQGWTLPGGGLDPGEHPEAAAVREIREETGLESELTGLLGVDSFAGPRLDGELMHAIRIVYSARVLGDELIVEVDGSTDDVGWFPLDEVASLDRVPLVDAGLRFWRESRA